MLRFFIRDVLWLTLVVAMGLGWLVRERQLRADVDEASKWRMAAGGLEEAIKAYALKVRWHFKSSEVVLSVGDDLNRSSGKTFQRQLHIGAWFTEPSAPQDD